MRKVFKDVFNGALYWYCGVLSAFWRKLQLKKFFEIEVNSG